MIAEAVAEFGQLLKRGWTVRKNTGLKIQVEGHTDSVGGDEYNMRLSENRAGAVRDFLVAQGVSSSSVTSQGFGKTMPVADNATAAGPPWAKATPLNLP